MHNENLNLFQNLIIIQNFQFRRLNQGWTSLGTIKFHSININACYNSHSSSSRWILFPKWTKIMKLELKRTINCCTKICTKVLQIYLCKLNLNVAFECCYITSFQVTSCDFFLSQAADCLTEWFSYLWSWSTYSCLSYCHSLHLLNFFMYLL